jgi:hypothetical protein
VHDGYEDSVFADCFANIFGIHDAVGAYADESYFEAVPLQELARFEDCVVFYCGGYYMPPAGFVGPSNPFDGPVIGLGGAAGEEYFVGIAAYESGYMLSGLVNSGPCFGA